MTYGSSLAAWGSRAVIYLPRVPRALLAVAFSAIAALILIAVPGEDAARAATDPPTTLFAVPPPGGAVQGVAGTNDPRALADAQLFDVLSISSFDVAGQRFYVYVPGAPAVVNTLTPSRLQPDSIVWLRRSGSDQRAITSPAHAMRGAPPELAATARLRVPVAGGATQGLAGVSAPDTLVDKVPFGVTSVTLFDFSTQRFLVYVPGAPPIVNTLGAADLDPHSIVWLRRPAGDVTPGLAPGALVSLAPSAAADPGAGAAPPPPSGSGSGFSAPPPPPASGGGTGGGGSSTPSPTPTPVPTPTPLEVLPEGGVWIVGVNDATVVVSSATGPADIVAAAELASGLVVAQLAVLGSSGWEFYVPGIPELSDLVSVGPGTVSALIFTQ